MKDKQTALRLMLLFKPSELWSSVSEFENDFAQYLLARGFEGRKVDVQGATDLLISINKVETIKYPEEPKYERVGGKDIRTYTTTTPKKK